MSATLKYTWNTDSYFNGKCTVFKRTRVSVMQIKSFLLFSKQAKHARMLGRCTCLTPFCMENSSSGILKAHLKKVFISLIINLTHSTVLQSVMLGEGWV